MVRYSHCRHLTVKPQSTNGDARDGKGSRAWHLLGVGICRRCGARGCYHLIVGFSSFLHAISEFFVDCNDIIPPAPHFPLHRIVDTVAFSFGTGVPSLMLALACSKLHFILIDGILYLLRREQSLRSPFPGHQQPDRVVFFKSRHLTALCWCDSSALCADHAPSHHRLPSVFLHLTKLRHSKNPLYQKASFPGRDCGLQLRKKTPRVLKLPKILEFATSHFHLLAEGGGLSRTSGKTSHSPRTLSPTSMPMSAPPPSLIAVYNAMPLHARPADIMRYGAGSKSTG